MYPHYSYDLGYISTYNPFNPIEAVYVEVEINYATNVMLMDRFNYSYYCEERYCSYYGGYTTSSPVTIKVPRSDAWILVIDNGGDDMDGIEATVHTDTYYE